MTIQPGSRFIVKKNLRVPTHGKNWTVYDQRFRVHHETFKDFKDAERLALLKEKYCKKDGGQP
jgi:hypothetical protein